MHSSCLDKCSLLFVLQNLLCKEAVKRRVRATGGTWADTNDNITDTTGHSGGDGTTDDTGGTGPTGDTSGTGTTGDTGNRGSGGDKTEPTSTGDGENRQVSVTVKNVFRPQTVYYYDDDFRIDDMGNKIREKVPRFTVWWGVALYIDDESLAKLVQRDSSGAYIVTHRTWQAKIDGKEYSDESWHLETVAYQEGKLKPNDNYSGPPGGARTMVTESGKELVALNYISAVNTGVGIGYSRGDNQIAVQVRWWVYPGSPGADVKGQFPKAGREPQLAYGIGWDHYLHNWWTKDKPRLEASAVAAGTFPGYVYCSLPSQPV